jgi:hypothetical protein
LIDFIGRIVLVFSERLGELAKRLAALDRPLSQVVAELDSAGMGDGEPLP